MLHHRRTDRPVQETEGPRKKEEKKNKWSVQQVWNESAGSGDNSSQVNKVNLLSYIWSEVDRREEGTEIKTRGEKSERYGNRWSKQVLWATPKVPQPLVLSPR